MVGGTIVLIIIGVMFTAVMVFAVIVRGRERAREWERSCSVKSETYRNLGMEEQANADLARAEFLMGAAQRGASERGTSLDGGVADINAGAVVGRILGVIVGVIAGFVVGCIMGFIYFCIFTGPAGAIFGVVAGYRVGGGDFGCAGGCLAVIAIWLFIVIVGVVAILS